MANDKWQPARISAFAISCSSEECDTRLPFGGGSSSQVLDQLIAAHDQGWQCLVSNVLEVACPSCAAKKRRRLQTHQVFRRKVASQPEWKRDVILTAWAATVDVTDVDLRETEMPRTFQNLLGDEGRNAAHVEAGLQSVSRAFQNRTSPNAVEAYRIAEQALRL